MDLGETEQDPCRISLPEQQQTIPGLRVVEITEIGLLPPGQSKPGLFRNRVKILQAIVANDPVHHLASDATKSMSLVGDGLLSTRLPTVVASQSFSAVRRVTG